MGYAGATYIVQEYCNALFDALFHILPLGTDLDRVEATPVRLGGRACSPGTTTRSGCSTAYVESEPFLVRISAAKRLRDRAERDARQAGEERVTAARVARALARSPRARRMRPFYRCNGLAGIEQRGGPDARVEQCAVAAEEDEAIEFRLIFVAASSSS